jgi:TetR/AcrR family transcriptional regulator
MDTRSRLLHEALSLFAARGYDAVGVAEIVEAAGVTKPTLYHYFGSKLGVLSEMVGTHGSPLYRALDTAMRYEGDLGRTLRAVATAYFADAQREPRYHRLRLALWIAPPESEAGHFIADEHLDEIKWLTTTFEAATRDHGNMRGRASSLAASFHGMIHVHIARFLRDGTPLDQALLDQALHQFQHGIYS